MKLEMEHLARVIIQKTQPEAQDIRKENLGHFVAENISTIVGLKEALTWKPTALRIVWAIALISGIAATVWVVYSGAAEYYAEPTATKLELVQQATYNYPPLIFCPDGWLDAEKALSLGISSDGLRYSLGFFQFFQSVVLENITSAREDFLLFYYRNNFTSLESYYAAVSVDTGLVHSLAEFAACPNSTILCPECSNKQSPEKLFFSTGLCYLFNLSPEYHDRSRKPYAVRNIMMKVSDRTKGIIRVTSTWRLYTTRYRNLAIKNALGSMLYLPTFGINQVRVTSQRTITLKRKNSTCVSATEAGFSYSSEKCYATCLSEAYDRAYGCRVFDKSVLSSSVLIDPAEYCNYLELSLSGYWERLEYISAKDENVSHSDDSRICMEKCPYECDKTVHEVTLRSRIEQPNLDRGAQGAATRDVARNLSVLQMFVEHGAVLQGGILTLTEVTTISFASMVSNLGGALGLFVGGTMMTFVQVVLFVVRCALDGCKRQ